MNKTPFISDNSISINEWIGQQQIGLMTVNQENERFDHSHRNSTLALFKEIKAWSTLNGPQLKMILNSEYDEVDMKINAILLFVDAHLMEDFLFWFEKFQRAITYKYKSAANTIQYKYVLLLIPLNWNTGRELIKYFKAKQYFEISKDIINYFIDPDYLNIYIALSNHNEMTSFSIHQDEKIRRLHIWYFRLYVLTYLLTTFDNKNLNSIILNDIDAIWIKNPYIFIDHLNPLQIDMMSGIGNHPQPMPECSLLIKANRTKFKHDNMWSNS